MDQQPPPIQPGQIAPQAMGTPYRSNLYQISAENVSLPAASRSPQTAPQQPLKLPEGAPETDALQPPLRPDFSTSVRLLGTLGG